MPIYEYVCRKCSKRFETLVSGSMTAECPACSSTALDKQLSVFATAVKGETGAAGDFPAGACGMCGDPRGPGACSS